MVRVKVIGVRDGIGLKGKVWGRVYRCLLV